MKCRNCGKEVRKGVAFCPECGANQKTAPRIKIIVPVIAVILCLAVIIPVACYLNSNPYLYKRASEYYEEGDYEKAAEFFSRITDYSDSEQMLEETWYLHAKECAKTSNYEEALDLIKKYEESLSERSGGDMRSLLTGERMEELALLKGKAAEEFRNQGKYEEAIGLYQELGNIWAAQRAQSILYTKEGKYEEAWECMKDDAGDYEDEWGQAVYQTARALADGKRYEDAILLIGKIEKHMKEAEVLLAECYENWGISYVQEGDYETAWKYFSMCDITETAKPYLYDVGKYYMNNGFYQEAAVVWGTLNGYQDSESQMMDCYRLQGAEYEQEGQYSAALEMYEKCGDAALVQGCRYNWAKYAYEQSDYELAMDIFTELGNYADSAEMISACRYQQARRAYSRGEYDLAIQIYTELGNYEDSADRMIQAQETKQKVEIENEKKARRGALDGTWKTSNGNLRIAAYGSSGGSLEFLLPVRVSSVSTIGGTFYGYDTICSIDEDLFDGADQQNSQYYYGYSGTDMALNRTYHWDHWDYADGTLYLRSPGGNWWTFDCTMNGNTMTLKMEERTFTLTKQ